MVNLHIHIANAKVLIMMVETPKKIRKALISVYHKEGLEPIVTYLHRLGVEILSTGGTYDWIASHGIPVQAVESLTDYPSILGGRVKTLHPKVFGGILGMREEESHQKEMQQYDIPAIDLVIVDLYPFRETVAAGGSEDDIIEKIDIGGISLIRAAAKNFNDVLVVASRDRYAALLNVLEADEGNTKLQERREFARHAFSVSSEYDAAIYQYFSGGVPEDGLRLAASPAHPLRYGENPHQQAWFCGELEKIATHLHGKALSYNNLVDLDAALQLLAEFSDPAFAVIKHNNACGLASRENILEAWEAALAGDPKSAFGGVIVCNRPIDSETAQAIDRIFFEILYAPDYSTEALEILSRRKNAILLKAGRVEWAGHTSRSLLNGIILQSRDHIVGGDEEWEVKTRRRPDAREAADLHFANRIVKHTRSNAIVLVKDRQLIGSVMGQTSRVDALQQAIDKAKSFGFDLQDAVLASDAFFPFSDSVEMASAAGIRAIIQPGGSVRDQDSIDFCDARDMAMVFTGIRHFRH